MAKKAYDESKIRAVADKIRELAENEKKYTTTKMPEGIAEVYDKGYDSGYKKCADDAQGKIQLAYDEGYAAGLAAGEAQGESISGLVLSFEEMMSAGLITYSDGVIYGKSGSDQIYGHLIIPSTFNDSKYDMPITALGEYAFEKCSNLKKVTIPKSITLISVGAFRYCEGLTEIIFKGTAAEWNGIEKAGRWDYYTSLTEVKCTDGTVAL